MKAMLMIFTALLAAGCAAASPHNTGRVDNEYRRESGQIEAIERFQRLSRSCDLAGGIVRIDRQSSGRFPLTAFEMRNATCDWRPG